MTAHGTHRYIQIPTHRLDTDIIHPFGAGKWKGQDYIENNTDWRLGAADGSLQRREIITVSEA